jgi:predicted ATPase/DNA-binding SARP family transcriptional activator
MRFRILGPLVVEDERGPIALGGPTPRALLAALLVDAGRVVSADRLVVALWGDSPPPGAVSALRAYASRLRGALGPGTRLRFQAPGYVLALDGAELDSTAFEGHLAAARKTAAMEDHASALEELDAGLALWHGGALAEFVDEEFAAAEAVRLEGLRAGAVEDRLQALVHLGRPAETISELEALVRRHPTRESTTVVLMHALYASGRSADALAAYHALRHRLDDELGVGPGREAQEAYRQVLVHDPALATVRPRDNLPRAVGELVGRAADVEGVEGALLTAPLVTLCGAGGVGKSSLAIEVARRERDRFPDGGWLCELASLADGGPVGYAVAGALGVQQRASLTIERTLIEYLRGRSLLLVLDNCEHVLDRAAELVAEIIRRCPGVVVLATSRERLGVAGERVWSVPPLPIVDGSALFVTRATAARPDFRLDPASAHAVATICMHLDGLPLGIELAAARMRAMTPIEVAERLAGGGLLGEHPGPVARHRSLAAAVDWSFRLLSDVEQQLFSRLSVFAGGCDARAACRVCVPDVCEDTAVDALTRLVDRSLVVAQRVGERTRYRVLETLRAYGRGLLGADAVALTRSHARYYTELAEEAALGLQGPHEQAWVERALPDYDNLRAAFECAFAERDVDLALRLATSMGELTNLRVGYEAAGWAERTLELADPDHPLWPTAVGAAARSAWNRAEFDRARSLVARAEGRASPGGTSRTSYPGDVLADVQLYEGDVDPALAYYEREALRARGTDPVRLVWTLYYVAICHAVRRQPTAGIVAARESLRVAEETANPTARSMARYALGLVLKKTDPDRSLALFEEAGRLAASVRNFWWHGIALMETAATRGVHGDAARACAEFLDVLDHWDRVGDWTQQWLNLRYITRLLARLGADGDARALHHCLVAAGKPSPLHDVGPFDVGPSDITAVPASAADAVARARAALTGFL